MEYLAAVLFNLSRIILHTSKIKEKAPFWLNARKDWSASERPKKRSTHLNTLNGLTLW